MGKTLIARSFAAALGLKFTRCSSLPTFCRRICSARPSTTCGRANSEFRRGPIFTNLLMADEINRTPPKTQAALLEAMAEGQVSIDGQTHHLPEPFIVIATDNPIEFEGTYPLPEAQLDRFAVKVALKYLSEQDETAMLRRRLERGSAEVEVTQIVDAQRLLAMQGAVEQVSVHDDVLRYVVALAAATRTHPQVVVGASPRAELDLVQLARAGRCSTAATTWCRRTSRLLRLPPSATGSACGRRCGCAACTAATSWNNCSTGCRCRVRRVRADRGPNRYRGCENGGEQPPDRTRNVGAHQN